MKKFKILMIVFGFSLIAAMITVFAAFMFNQTITNSAKVGNIHIVNQQFISYAPTVDHTDSTTYPGGKADPNYLEDIKARTSGVAFTASSVTCYATEKEGYSEEEVATSTDYFYLNQLGFNISFYTDIDVYVRIKFQDAWIRIKTYNGVPLDPEYIIKGQFNVPTAAGSGWVFHNESNSYNYVGTNNSTAIISPSTVDNPFNATFNLDSSYFYEIPEEQQISNGHMAVLVQVSFSIEVIQANRAYKLWGYDPSDLS